jgi:hypothetical protein
MRWLSTKATGSSKGVFAYLVSVDVEEEEEDANMVTGTIPLFGSLACTLFYSGVTDSFVSTAYAKLCDMNLKTLMQSVTVVTPVEDSLTW